MHHAVETLTRPTFVLFVVLGLGLFNLWRKRRETRRRLLWVTVPFFLLVAISIPAVAYLALGTLEGAYPPSTELPDRPDVILVLSGYMVAPKNDSGRAELAADTYYRCRHALALYRKAGNCPLLLSGGVSQGAPEGPPLADTMRTFFRQQGVPAVDLLVENHSSTTYENALECARILRPRGLSRVVLVTDARHMARASLCFARQGLQVFPSPCNSATERFRNRWEAYLPGPGGAGGFLDAFHEWVGLAYYKLRGWI